jgi:hypothetical protein
VAAAKKVARAKRPASARRHAAAKPARGRAVSADPAVPQGAPASLCAARAVLRGERQPQGQAGGVPARRPGRRHRPGDAPFLRSEALPHRAVRPARLRRQPAARRAAREHHLGPGGRPRGAARSSGARALDGVRRLLGFDPGARLFAAPSRARHRAGAARYFPAAPLRARMVLSGSAGRGVDLPGSVGEIPGADSARSAPT